MDIRKAKLPEGAMTSRELVQARLEAYIAENGTRSTAAEAGLAHSTLNRIRRGEMSVSAPLAELLGFETVTWKFYVPQSKAKSARARK